MTETPDREEQVERLPTPSPLAGQLEALVAASDRATTASEYGLDYRASEGTVRVSIELEPDGSLPTGYRVEEASRTGTTIVADVAVDDLVPLAMDDNVRKIRPPATSRTH